jgi:hypothetical protein
MGSLVTQINASCILSIYNNPIYLNTAPMTNTTDTLVRINHLISMHPIPDITSTATANEIILHGKRSENDHAKGPPDVIESLITGFVSYDHLWSEVDRLCLRWNPPLDWTDPVLDDDV